MSACPTMSTRDQQVSARRIKMAKVNNNFKHTDDDDDDKEVKMTDDTLINILNDDCLMHIFQFLPILDRIRIERVSKRWRRVSWESWFNFTSLNLYNEPWGVGLTSHDMLVGNPHPIYEILKRCGRFLKILDYAGYIDDLLKVGVHIGSLCPNLQSIDLAGVSSVIIENIAEHCTDIRNFCLRDTINSCDHELSLLFSRNKKLKTLEFTCEYETSGGKFLLDIPTEYLETFNVLNCTLPTKYFNQAIRKMKNLSKFSFDFCDDFDDESMAAICSLTNLKEIQTGIWLGCIHSLNPICNLINLKTVEFSMSDYVDDEFLIMLCQNCRELSDVNISGCTIVTDIGVESITLLPNIERLNLDFLSITDRAFNPMPKLKEIECVKCKNISDKCFSRIIKTSKNLELLNVCYCKVHNSIIKTAINSTKKRSNKITLKMYVQGTKIDADKIMDKSPFLEVIFAHRQLDAKNYV